MLLYLPPSPVHPLRVVVVDDDDEECACVTNGPDYFYCLFALILPSCVCVFPFMFSFSFHQLAVCACVFVCGFAHLCVTNKFSKINKDNNPFECAAIELFTAIAHCHIGCPLPRFALVSGQHTHIHTHTCTQSHFTYVQHLTEHCVWQAEAFGGSSSCPGWD